MQFETPTFTPMLPRKVRPYFGLNGPSRVRRGLRGIPETATKGYTWSISMGGRGDPNWYVTGPVGGVKMSSFPGVTPQWSIITGGPSAVIMQDLSGIQHVFVLTPIYSSREAGMIAGYTVTETSLDLPPAPVPSIPVTTVTVPTLQTQKILGIKTGLTLTSYALSLWDDSQVTNYTNDDVAAFYASYIGQISKEGYIDISRENSIVPDIYTSINAQISARGMSLPLIPDVPSGYARIRPIPYPSNISLTAFAFSGDSGTNYLTVPNSEASHFFVWSTVQTSGLDTGLIYHRTTVLNLTTNGMYSLDWNEVGGAHALISDPIGLVARIITDVATLPLGEPVELARAAGAPDKVTSIADKAIAAISIAVATVGAGTVLTAPAETTAAIATAFPQGSALLAEALPMAPGYAAVEAAGSTLLPASLSLVSGASVTSAITASTVLSTALKSLDAIKKVLSPSKPPPPIATSQPPFSSILFINGSSDGTAAPGNTPLAQELQKVAVPAFAVLAALAAFYYLHKK